MLGEKIPLWVSSKQWYKKFNSFMLVQGYRNIFDCCVYFKHMPNKISIYLLSYVDDMLIASQSTEEIQKLKLRLKSPLK